MYSFFVLGQIPGTGIIITFSMWVLTGALLSTLLVWMAYRRHLAMLDYQVPTISDEAAALHTATAQ